MAAKDRECLLTGCTKPQHCRGLCNTCYTRNRVNGTLDTVALPPISDPKMHRLTEIDVVAKVAVCSVCGITDIVVKIKNDKFKSQCITRVKEYQERKKERYKPKKATVEELINRKAKKYNISQEKVLDLVGPLSICSVCKKNQATDIDHDHTCCPGINSCGNCVRGGLCNRCNQALGLLYESITTLEEAIKYLQTFK